MIMVIMSDTQRQGKEVESVRPLDGIRLQPLLHQVSGRAIMMCLNETTVCKPLNSREYCFYQSLPRDILQYTPQYKGVVNVNIEEKKDGTIALTAFPPSGGEGDVDPEEKDSDSEECLDRRNNNAESCTRVVMQVHSAGERGSRKRVKLKRTGSFCIEKTDDGSIHSSEVEKTSCGPRLNPWTLKVLKEGLPRHLHSKNKVVQKCILLENVTSHFKWPCILDLKMGTRVHGDFDDDEKRKRHLEKCAKTTTQALGVRLAGMQVYRHKSGSGTFLCRNKYFGRGLTVDGFHRTLREFFYDGCQTRTDVIYPVIDKLRSLTKRLNRLPSYRFYSSSLLIIYDGAIEADKGQSHVDDEANASLPSDSNHRHVALSDEDFSGDRRRNSRSDATASVDFAHKGADVRMIDFAKATHRNMDKSVVHKGPDKGYIFGLENLIQVLSSILAE